MSNNKNPAPKPSGPQTPASAAAPPTAPTPQPDPAAAPAVPESAPQTPPGPEPSSSAAAVATDAAAPPPPAAPKAEPSFLAAYVGDAAEVSHRGYHFPRNIDVLVSPEVWARLERHPMFRVSRGDGDV